jgi:hypothetical protein
MLPVHVRGVDGKPSSYVTLKVDVRQGEVAIALADRTFLADDAVYALPRRRDAQKAVLWQKLSHRRETWVARPQEKQRGMFLIRETHQGGTVVPEPEHAGAGTFSDQSPVPVDLGVAPRMRRGTQTDDPLMFGRAHADLQPRVHVLLHIV